MTAIKQRAHQMIGELDEKIDVMSDDTVETIIQMIVKLTPSEEYDPFADENSTFEECAAVFDEQLNDTLPDPEDDPFFSPQNQAVLRKSMVQMEGTGGTVHEVAWNE